jgi:hypothetical protein
MMLSPNKISSATINKILQLEEKSKATDSLAAHDSNGRVLTPMKYR